jgi:hypothetical protein
MPGVSPSLGVGLVLTSLYYLAASLVFPDDPEKERIWMHITGRTGGSSLV